MPSFITLESVPVRQHGLKNAAIKRWRRLLRSEKKLFRQGYQLVGGIDEAGRGPLAGPVVAAAVVIDARVVIPGIDDSKSLSERQRISLFEPIYNNALSVGVGIVDEKVIDSENILQATWIAMRQAVANLLIEPQMFLVDGKMTIPKLSYPQQAVIQGDKRCASIAAASIIAKVTRDRLMADYHEEFPDYGFNRHKGYPTKAHIEAIKKHGPCPIHRLSFKRVIQTD